MINQVITAVKRGTGKSLECCTVPNDFHAQAIANMRTYEGYNKPRMLAVLKGSPPDNLIFNGVDTISELKTIVKSDEYSYIYDTDDLNFYKIN